MTYTTARRALMAIGVALAQITLSGCATVSYVGSIGMRKETLDISSPGRVYVMTNGTVAIEVYATYKTTKWLSGLQHGHPKRVVYSRNKYIVGDFAVVTNAILRSQSVDVTASNTLIRLTHYAVTSTNEPQWRVYPSRFESERSSLPVEFKGGYSAVTGKFDYCIGGRNYEVQVPVLSYIGREEREKKCWWAIPTVPLIIPALAIDIVTFPIQAYYALGHAW